MITSFPPNFNKSGLQFCVCLLITRAPSKLLNLCLWWYKVWSLQKKFWNFIFMTLKIHNLVILIPLLYWYALLPMPFQLLKTKNCAKVDDRRFFNCCSERNLYPFSLVQKKKVLQPSKWVGWLRKHCWVAFGKSQISRYVSWHIALDGETSSCFITTKVFPS